jgi:anaerobic dimethyl sulfoxide reductase subunit A
MIPSIPKYIPHKESHDASKSKIYPLQLLTTHHKTRAHSTWQNVPWMREVESHAAWIHPDDANSRRIRHGDMVDVYNDNGRVRIPAKVTERIMPGVVNVSQGAWYNPDAEGIDVGGCANVLTKDTRSPGGAVAMNSTLVQVELSPKQMREGN